MSLITTILEFITLFFIAEFLLGMVVAIFLLLFSDGL